MEQARRGGDAERLALAHLQLARVEVFRTGAAPEPDWLAELMTRVQAGTAQGPAVAPALEAALLDLRGLQLATRGDFPEAIAALTRACELARASGQQRRAIGLASNLGVAYTRLGDFETALDWLR
jgi:tetratricopeptide (TPR) repeat protein